MAVDAFEKLPEKLITEANCVGAHLCVIKLENSPHI